MMNQIKIAIVQCSLNHTRAENVDRVASLIERAAAGGAKVIVTPELFEGPYFCKSQKIVNFSLAHEVAGHPTLERMRAIAKAHTIVLPVSFFEKDRPHYYNSAAIIDADGEILGIYRKSHISDGPGYQEKYCFRPGNTGIKVWNTRYLKLGVGICWDQWFPEVARELALQGAELIVYPTAIGTEPMSPELDTKELWQRAMVGHAVCNVVPVAAANRVGQEDGQTFYGSSFICDHAGDKQAELSRTEEGVAYVTLDLAAAHTERAAFGFFRDRRPEPYRHTNQWLKNASTQPTLQD